MNIPNPIGWANKQQTYTHPILKNEKCITISSVNQGTESSLKISADHCLNFYPALPSNLLCTCSCILTPLISRTSTTLTHTLRMSFSGHIFWCSCERAAEMEAKYFSTDLKCSFKLVLKFKKSSSSIVSLNYWSRKAERNFTRIK